MNTPNWRNLTPHGPPLEPCAGLGYSLKAWGYVGAPTVVGSHRKISVNLKKGGELAFSKKCWYDRGSTLKAPSAM